MSKPKPEATQSSNTSVWLLAGGLAVGIVMIALLMSVIVWNGLAVFWPREVVVFDIDGAAHTGPLQHDRFSGIILERRNFKDDDGGTHQEYYLYTGNEEVYGQAFHYLPLDAIVAQSKPESIYVVERLTKGRAIIDPVALSLPDGSTVDAGTEDFSLKLWSALESNKLLREQMEKLELESLNPLTQQLQNAIEADQAEEIVALDKELQRASLQMQKLRQQSQASTLSYRLFSGEIREQPLAEVVEVHQPNRMGPFEKLGFFATHFWRFLVDSPRQGNTQGGIFPIIVGTFVLTLLMSALVMPLGVVAAIYLNEYARNGPIIHGIRIAVSNLAGVPSIVYGVFGLGFFVYFLGGNIDSLFFSDKLPAPTFGTGGILWAALTLALLTLPVVIVATEESLTSFPRGMREASMACGASHWQTIWRVVLPASAPGMLTGLILAIARAAGEVAPLMLVGVVAFATDMPVTADAPWLHLDRKFMHMGYHIYSLGFLSPDSEAAMPMVYATTLLLILIVVMLNVGAILMRDFMRRKYAGETF